MTSASDRISTRPHEQSKPRVEERDGVWLIRSAEVARQVLRARDATTQAGFTAESLTGRMKDTPILFMDGEPHRQQRAKVARYFAPKTVATRYHAFMEARADALIASMADQPTSRLDRVTLRYSVEVASQVIGLTNSDMDKMAGRLEKFFDQPPFDLTRPGVGRSRFQAIRAAIAGNLPMLAFYLADVRPAIVARRKDPQEDVITHLLGEGYADSGILIECVTYGAAGMVTTREFISMATLHFLRTPPLRDRYLTAGEPERLAILGEILRLEPVVGHLFRRAQADLTVTDGDQTHTIPQGALIDLGTRQTNADERIVGAEPERICPGRDLPKGWSEEVMSFGDGPHKCPGNALALRESDVFLTRLLGHDLELVTEPHLEWDELIAGYGLRGFEIAVR